MGCVSTNAQQQFNYYLFSTYSGYFIEEENITSNIVTELLNEFKTNDENFVLINN